MDETVQGYTEVGLKLKNFCSDIKFERFLFAISIFRVFNFFSTKNENAKVKALFADTPFSFKMNEVTS